jgi:hypothetical protein
MILLGNHQPVKAPKYKWGLPEFDENQCAASQPPPVSAKVALERLVRIPDHSAKIRALSPMIRSVATHRLAQAIFPISTTAQAYQAISRLMPSTCLGRDFNDPNFFLWARRVRENFRKNGERTKIVPYTGPGGAGQAVAYPRSMLICGPPDAGKTTIVHQILSVFYRDRVLEHVNKFGDAFIQIPYLFVQCSHLGSALGLVKEIIRAIAFLVGCEPEYLCSKVKTGGIDDLLPEMVNLLLLYSVGPIFIDEAEAIQSRASGGKLSLVQLWVRLINECRTSIVLICNPDIEKGLNKQLKARLRFCGQGTIRFDRLEQDSLDWSGFMRSLGEIQFTKRPTELTPEIMAIMHEKSQGLLKLAIYLWEWTQNLAIDRRGKEEITPALIAEAYRLNGSLVHDIIHGIAHSKGNDLSSVADDIDCSWMQRDGLIEATSSTDDSTGKSQETQIEGKDEGEEDESTEKSEPSAVPRSSVKPATANKVGPAKIVAFVRCANDEKFKKGRTPHQALKEEGWISSTEEFA